MTCGRMNVGWAGLKLREYDIWLDNARSHGRAKTGNMTCGWINVRWVGLPLGENDMWLAKCVNIL